MKVFIIIFALIIVSYATEYELHYDCGLPSDDGNYGIGGPVSQQLRVRFTTPSNIYGSKLTKTKVHWKNAPNPSDLHFHFTILEENSGLTKNSQSFVITPQDIWLTYDISSLNYIANSNDFYVEIIPESGGPAGCACCQHPPIDLRSQWYSTNNPVWTTITNYDLCIRAILDDSFISVSPASLGQLRALFK